ncbi:inovirus-type Gp2 protein [Ottowia beijingensis]|uniref:Inovirus-type Gp2 protein n=1 Tax=Ottowia beijingensis TaxID=1207057 RepID=A0A853IVS8_9BURK|nr:inovirus-type Gp2 protein [Ottowia beijingensis]NZA01150.1 inovirus-type Gp2 protein [Ottowia beijingensis]
MNKIVAELKIAMAQPSFRAAEKNWARRTSRARWRFFKLFKATLARHSKVMVVRIDFGLKRHELYNSKEPRTPWPQATVNPNAPHAGAQVQAEDQRLKNLLQQLGFDEIDTAREKSLRRIRDVFGSGLLGYIWKLEYGARKGFHYHCVFLLNGSVHRQDISIGNQIGKIWADYAPNGLGIFRNCNANRGYYKFPAVGMLQYHESRHWKGLSHIANYLSKPDYYVLLKLPSDQKHRTFGTSVIPRLTTNKPGPHRRKSFGLQGNPL